MNVIAVDDEALALEGIVSLLQRCLPEAKVYGFTNPVKALGLAESLTCEIALLDIEMVEMNGVELARQLREIHPRINIIFTTGYSEYAAEAIDLHASGYLLKPITEKKLRRELADLRYVPQDSLNRLSVRAFGSFEVFFNGRPLHFRYSKSKELMAYLVDRRGTMCSNGEIIAALWGDGVDDDRSQSYLRNIRSDLISTLGEIGCGSVVIRQRNLTGIDPDKISCDYFSWLKGDPSVENEYRGEYMRQYGWSEFTNGWLEKQAETRKGTGPK